MPYRVVTIARSLGAGGEEVGRLIAEQLGFRLVADEIIARAAERASASPDEVARVEQRKSFITRVIEAMAAAPPPGGEGWTGDAFIPMARTEAYQDFITDVIREVAGEGNVVIVAHGAAVPLAGEPDVLRVFVTGSAEARAAAAAADFGGDAKKALEAVHDSDKSRADFYRRFYGLREETFATYDLILNTDQMAPPAAAGVVVSAVKNSG
jgi:cytidylate kinase